VSDANGGYETDVSLRLDLVKFGQELTDIRCKRHQYFRRAKSILETVKPQGSYIYMIVGSEDER